MSVWTLLLHTRSSLVHTDVLLFQTAVCQWNVQRAAAGPTQIVLECCLYILACGVVSVPVDVPLEAGPDLHFMRP